MLGFRGQTKCGAYLVKYICVCFTLLTRFLGRWWTRVRVRKTQQLSRNHTYAERLWFSYFMSAAAEVRRVLFFLLLECWFGFSSVASLFIYFYIFLTPTNAKVVFSHAFLFSFSSNKKEQVVVGKLNILSRQLFLNFSKISLEIREKIPRN